MRIMVLASAVISLILIVGCASLPMKRGMQIGQHPQEIKTTITKVIDQKYLLFLPADYDKAQKRWPLMLFLHGAGERGDNLELVKKHGPPKIVETKPDFPFILVSPQCPERQWWTNNFQIEFLNVLLDHIVEHYRVDTDRIYLTGLSMGGFGTWRLASVYPERFAAIVPICGGGEPLGTRNLIHVPVWAFHGAKDETVPIERTEEMVNALKERAGNVKVTIYPEAGHDSWTETYDNPELYEWFLSHKKH